jgi:hypothetical protein
MQSISERNKKILDLIDEYTKCATVSQKTARETLIREGIYTKSGKLRAEYGGSSRQKNLQGKLD